MIKDSASVPLDELVRLQPRAVLVDAYGRVLAIGDKCPPPLDTSMGRVIDEVLGTGERLGDGSMLWRPATGQVVLGRTLQLSRRVRAYVFDPAEPPSGADRLHTLAGRIVLRTGRVRRLVALDGITRIESQGNYCRVFMGEESFVAGITMTELEGMLPAERFVRIHRSHLVSIAAITSYGTDQVTVGDVHLPVGIRYRQAFAARMHPRGVHDLLVDEQERERRSI
jgi:hypothetical protein